MLNEKSVPFCPECPIEDGSRVYCAKCAKKQIDKLDKFNDEPQEE